MVAALNVGEIPSAGSITETFNQQLVKKVLSEFTATFKGDGGEGGAGGAGGVGGGKLSLPTDEVELEDAFARASATAKERFARERFGRGDTPSGRDQYEALVKAMEDMRQQRRDANILQSMKVRG